MRTGAAAGHHGFLHDAALYGSDEEFLAVVVPFLQGGLDAGEPTVVALGETTARLVRAAMPDMPNLSFAAGRDRCTRPANVIKSARETLAGYVADGAQQIRMVGEVPHPGVGAPWEWWARYEAAINRAWDDFPIWGLCPYDTRITPEYVLDDVVRTHPYTVTADGQHLANPRFDDPAEFLVRRPPSADPLEALPPVTELVDPTPAAARRAVFDVARTTDLDSIEVNDLVYAVNEAVTNGICHGRPPVQLRLWTGADRIVATVTDHGAGPADPFAGLLPTLDSSSAGIGLWITHLMCSHVTLDRNEHGFTIRLTAGTPHL